MTRARTVALLLAAVGMIAASPLARAATTTVLQTVRYEIGRDFAPDAWYTGDPVVEHNWDSNTGAGAWLRIKGWQHMYHGDWDTAAMQLDVDPGGALTGWGSYGPIYSLSIMPIVSSSWPATPVPIHISCVWSENDWFEGDGAADYNNYNWSNPISTYAATYLYAGDTLITSMVIPWTFPGGGVGANAPYPRDVDCASIGTFLTHGDLRDDWNVGAMETKTPTNSTDIIAGLADEGSYVTADLDQAIIDDMLQNAYNRGLALWNLTDWNNKNTYSDDQNITQWPYIEARIEVLAGDANLDKAVDGLDYVAWSNNYNQAATWQTGDFNNDLLADGLDYVVWSNNYGETLPAAPGAPVPDPATMALLAVGGLALLKRRPGA